MWQRSSSAPPTLGQQLSHKATSYSGPEWVTDTGYPFYQLTLAERELNSRLFVYGKLPFIGHLIPSFTCGNHLRPGCGLPVRIALPYAGSRLVSLIRVYTHQFQKEKTLDNQPTTFLLHDLIFAFLLDKTISMFFSRLSSSIVISFASHSTASRIILLFRKVPPHFVCSSLITYCSLPGVIWVPISLSPVERT